MLDKNGRITLGAELLKEARVDIHQRMYFYYEPEYKRLALKKAGCFDNMLFVKEQTVDEKGRIFIPASVRNAFPEATYLPVVMRGEIYILIIEHEKKSE